MGANPKKIIHGMAREALVFSPRGEAWWWEFSLTPVQMEGPKEDHLLRGNSAVGSHTNRL